jgi:hypothetical protein
MWQFISALSVGLATHISLRSCNAIYIYILSLGCFNEVNDVWKTRGNFLGNNVSFIFTTSVVLQELRVGRMAVDW